MMVYEVVFWDQGVKTTLGFFPTQRLAKNALTMAKKYYLCMHQETQDRLHDGIAGFECIEHKMGFSQCAQGVIDFGRKMKDGE